MSFNIITSEMSGSRIIFCSTHNHCIPIDPANRDYQKVLDDIIEQGASCFDGDIPAELQAAADAKQFAQQLAKYNTAVARLALYVLSEGRAEVKGMQETGEQVYNEETLIWEDVTETFVIPAIPALEATVEVTTQEMGKEPVTTTVANPLITKDNEERAAAQAIVDVTPALVKTHVDK